MEIVRNKLTPDVLYSKNLRYNATTDEVEYTNDGGTTWTPAPGQDPRLVAQVPPPDTADPACDGAERIVEHYQDLVAAFLTGASGGVTSVVTAFLLLLFPAFALLIIIINLVVNGLLAIGAEDVADSFLGSEWDDFKCIVYNNIGADGFVTEAGFATIRSDVNAQIGGTAATVLNLLMDMTGYGGMNDAAGQRTETGDCSSCATWCVVYDFRDGTHGFAAQEFDVPGTPVGVLTSSGWETEYTFDTSFGFRSVNIGRDFSAFTLLTADIQFRSGVKGNFTGAPAAAFRADLFTASGQEVGNGDPVGDFVMHADNPNGAGWNLLARMGDANSPDNGDPGGNIVIESVTLTGTGDKPTGGVDC